MKRKIEEMDDYLNQHEQREGRESIATRYMYNFPDTSVVIARKISDEAGIRELPPEDRYQETGLFFISH